MSDPFRDVRITLVVVGVPSPQGSKTKMPNGAMVEAGSATGRQKLRNWRNDVRTAAQVWREANGDPALLDGPLVVDMHFWMPRPKARKHDLWVPTKPDISKLVRATEDALTGVIWRDDSLIVASATSKRYTQTAEHLPGATIHIERPTGCTPPAPKKTRKKAA